MNFAEAESYLYSLGNEVETMKLGLENITAVLGALGDPQTNYVKVQVAGTNGKGSVCAFLDSICTEAGIKAGLYTSPHLVSITERIRIGGRDIGEDEFARLAARVREVSESLVSEGKLDRVPTYFEQVTAIALLAFAEAGVELAILETGLGGRFDATTAANAEIAAITRIDLDHQEYLGDTIEEIAAEKAAIIREDSSVVIGAQRPEAMKILREHCEALSSNPLDEVYSQWTVSPDGRGSVTVETTRHIFQNVCLGLMGRHQIENAETAINVVKVLRYEMGLDIDDKYIVEGLEKARHPGRLEQIGNYLLDGAHNRGGATALAAYLDEFVDQPITMIFGSMRDKDVRRIAEVLWPKAEKLILTNPSNSRAMSPEELVEFAPDSIDVTKVLLAGSAAEAIEAAREVSDGTSVVVTGSLYLVGEVKKLLAQGDEPGAEI